MYDLVSVDVNDLRLGGGGLLTLLVVGSGGQSETFALLAEDFVGDECVEYLADDDGVETKLFGTDRDGSWLPTETTISHRMRAAA